jgi:ABC-2 type transport system permease protein
MTEGSGGAQARDDAETSSDPVTRGRAGTMGRADATSNIYDLGYRGYGGPRLGRRGAIGALAAHSLRTTWGLGRSARSKLVPVGLLVLALLPAIVALGIAAVVSQVGGAGEAIEALSPIRYSSLFPIMATLVMLFCAAQAPELFGRDQRDGVLPLYFSRAIARLDYAGARAIGLLASLAFLVLVPQLILLVGRILAAPALADGIAEETPSLPSILVVGSLMCALLGSVASAVAALTPRRSYATVAIIAVFIVPAIIVALVSELADGALARATVLLSPGDILDGLNAWVFGVRPDSTAVRRADLDGWLYVVAAGAWIAGAAVVLARRYRTVGA